MTEIEAWLQSNDAYLTAAVSAIHARLKRLAAPSAEPVKNLPAVVPSSVQDDEHWFGSLFRRRSGPRTPATPGPDTVLVADSQGRIHPETQSIDVLGEAAARAEGVPSFGPPAALRLQSLLGLSRFELETLLLCAAMELNTGTAQLCAEAQRNGFLHPTFALAMAMFDDPAWDAASPERPLRYWRLLEITQVEGQPLTASCLCADERIVNYLKGLHYLDDRLAPLLAPLPIPTGDGSLDLSPSQLSGAAEITAHLKASLHHQSSRFPVVQLTGAATRSKNLVAADVARQLGIGLYRVSASALPPQRAELAKWARLWRRETALRPVGLVVDSAEGEERALSGEMHNTVLHLLSEVQGLVFLDCREAWSGIDGDTLVYEIDHPTPAEQTAAWTAALGADAGGIASRLAGQFTLDFSDLRSIAAQQQALGKSGLSDLWQACLVRSRPSLDLLAKRIVATATWSDIVLPEPASRMLQEIADQVDNRSQVYDSWGFRRKMTRGLGISVLFEGKSGCGKTMAAEVIANQLQLDLYRIDLSGVISKYIGETEKNLRRLFDAAQDGGCILCFDECDAIFGKRTEVKDSHDRYANIEVNYLLQRMEAYSGLAILSTNMKSALDTAFMRRLRFVVSFPVPGPTERKQIWMKAFPGDTPLETDHPAEMVDYDRLAKVNLTGGGISNAALNAAFLAARAGGRVTMSLLSCAIEAELRKMERPVQPV